MNISNSDRLKKWIGASSAGPRGPATRASRLSVTGVCLGRSYTPACYGLPQPGRGKPIEENPAIEPPSTVVLLAGSVRAAMARRCPTLSRMSSVSSAARLELEIGCHPIQVGNHPAQAVALATNRADLLLLLTQPLGSPAHR